MSRRKAVQFSRAGLNAGDGGGGGGDEGSGEKVSKDSVKKSSLKEGREDSIFANLLAVVAPLCHGLFWQSASFATLRG